MRKWIVREVYKLGILQLIYGRAMVDTNASQLSGSEQECAFESRDYNSESHFSNCGCGRSYFPTLSLSFLTHAMQIKQNRVHRVTETAYGLASWFLAVAIIILLKMILSELQVHGNIGSRTGFERHTKDRQTISLYIIPILIFILKTC